MINNSKHQIISSNIAPNPIEVKFWLDTNSDTIKTYKNGKWEAMTGGGSSSSGEPYILDLTEVFTTDPDENGFIQISEKLYNEIPKIAGKCNVAKLVVMSDDVSTVQTFRMDWYGGTDGNETFYYITLYWTAPGSTNAIGQTFVWSAAEKNCLIRMPEEL